MNTDTQRRANKQYRRVHGSAVRQANVSRMATRRREAKQAVFDMYGRECACCGTSEWQFLTIDHAGGGGTQERAGLPVGHQYVALARQPKRDDLQVLCFNCHMAKDLYGGCPHKLAVVT